MNAVRKVIKADKTYYLTCDEYGVLDTVMIDGKALVSTQAVCRQFIRHADKFLAHERVAGFAYA